MKRLRLLESNRSKSLSYFCELTECLVLLSVESLTTPFAVGHIAC